MTNSDRFEVAPPPPAPREFQQARAKKTYENILQAAAELYSERGFHAVQTPDIAKRAGISVGGLYRYFKDKHQIFAELVHRILERNRLEQVQMMSELECQFVEEGTDLHDIAERLINWTWDALRDAPPDLLRTLEAMRHEDTKFGLLCDQYDRYERHLLARTLTKVTSRDVIPSPLAAARVLDLIIPTVALWAKLHPSDSRGVKNATLDMVVRYLAGAQKF